MLNVGNSKRVEEKKANGSALSIYDSPPMVEVSLDEFEEFAIDRLQVLKVLESHRLRGLATSKDMDNKVDKIINKCLPLRLNTPSDPNRQQRDMQKDVISHFILRMAFCINEELRRWFVSHESYLFRYRLDKLLKEDKLKFMKDHGISYEQVSTEELKFLEEKLRACSDGKSQDKRRDLGIHFKIPFTEALDLVGSRKVFVHLGIAYVPFDHLVSILCAHFRTNLSRDLAIAYKRFPRSKVGRDDRMGPILKNLAKHHITPDFTVQTSSTQDRITPEMIDGLAKVSMPLCMRSLHNAVKTQNHLKHGGRMQYGLFLKGIGVSLDDSLAFWKQEFCKKISVDDFNKKYAYNIRHNYGKEGRRKDYTPHNCSKIINGDPPKNGDYHGCPFRHFDEFHLKSSLRGVKESDRDNIIQLVQTKQFQLACRKYFEATHPNGNSDGVGNHPNAYYEESRKYYDMKEKSNTK